MKRQSREVIVPMLSCAILALASLVGPGCGTYPRAPEQPRSGFGGADYVTAQVRKQYVELDEQAEDALEGICHGSLTT